MNSKRHNVNRYIPENKNEEVKDSNYQEWNYIDKSLQK